MAYVPPEYPGDIPEFAEVWPPVDDVNWMYTSAWDALVKEVRAIMAELGTDPAGASADVKTRLDVQQHKITDDDGDSYEDVEKTADVDEAVTYLKNVLIRKFHDDGILDLPKQSGCYIYLSADQNIAAGVSEKAEFNTEVYDNQNEYDAVTNFRFTAKKAGTYDILADILFHVTADQDSLRVILFKNGAYHSLIYFNSSGTFSQDVLLPRRIKLAANDYIEIWVENSTNNDIVDGHATDPVTYLSITKLN